MAIDVLLIIAVTSFIQSLFGVGVLLFGTPLLLLVGYDFIDAIIILLPISIIINLIQIAKDYRNVDFDLYKKILLYTIPLVVLFLFLVTQVRINISFLVGIFLLTVALKDYSKKVNTFIQSTLKHEKIYLGVMGIIHGMTNLGGSLLTAIVHNKDYKKQITRVTIAISYATFAVFQILTLLISGYDLNIRFLGVGIYLLVGIGVFILTERLVYVELNNENYTKFFGLFLFISGMMLVVKSI